MILNKKTKLGRRLNELRWKVFCLHRILFVCRFWLDSIHINLLSDSFRGETNCILHVNVKNCSKKSDGLNKQSDSVWLEFPLNRDVKICEFLLRSIVVLNVFSFFDSASNFSACLTSSLTLNVTNSHQPWWNNRIWITCTPSWSLKSH